jgi:hypothetical protein
MVTTFLYQSRSEGSIQVTPCSLLRFIEDEEEDEDDSFRFMDAWCVQADLVRRGGCGREGR